MLLRGPSAWQWLLARYLPLPTPHTCIGPTSSGLLPFLIGGGQTDTLYTARPLGALGITVVIGLAQDLSHIVGHRGLWDGGLWDGS